MGKDKRKAAAGHVASSPSKKAKQVNSASDTLPARALGEASTSGPSTAPPNPKLAKAKAKLEALTAKLQSAIDNASRSVINAKMLLILAKHPDLRLGSDGSSNNSSCSSRQGVQQQQRQVKGMNFAPGSMSAGGFVPLMAKTPSAFTAAPVPVTAADRARRQQRFGGCAAAQVDDDDDGDVALRDAGGQGTSEALEKDYLRLTSLPRQADVRPPRVLAAALKLVKARWLERADYNHACEQLKSIRQDLTVQHVKDKLTVDVYETHGRLALEVGDLAEFRRCHAVLRGLYKEGLPGNAEEFEGYGLLYTQATPASRNLLSKELAVVPQAMLRHEFVEHALSTCLAFRANDYTHFMALYRVAPRMSPYLMDQLLPAVRASVLRAIVAAHKPIPVPLSLLAAQLGMETEDEAADYAESLGAVVNRQTRELDTRASAAKPLGLPRPSEAAAAEDD